MKIKNLFFTLAAGVALTACSSDEPAANGGQTGNGDFNYVAVSIQGAPEASGKADSDYADGEASEYNVNGGAIFVFFRPDGSLLQYVKKTATELGDWTDINDKTANKEIKTVVKLNASSVKPASVVCVLNPTPNFETALGGVGSLTGLRNQAFTTLAEAAKTNEFTMTNSVYSNGTAPVYATAIAANQVYTSQAEAEAATASTIDIYVERVVAKAVVTPVSTGFQNGGLTNADVVGSDDKLTITPKIEGYALITTTTTASVLKSIDALALNAYSPWEWNDATNFRSYWAANGSREVANLSWDEIDAANDGGFTQYVFPNNQDPSADVNNYTKSTKLIVAATLQCDGKDIAPIKYANVLYKDETAYLTQIAKELKQSNIGYKYTEGENTITGDYGVDDLKIVRFQEGGEDHAYKITFALANSVKTPADQDAFDTFVANAKPALYWKGGKTYYYVPVSHIAASKMYGMIRNHCYMITVNGLGQSLGTPVFDPTEKIEPNRPTDDPDNYISARVRILKWRVVNQNVTLE